MYANTDNPPGTDMQIAMPRLDPDEHLYKLSCISRLLALITQSRERIAYSSRQHDTYSLQCSPYVSRARWQEDMRKWSYITCRLERYYLRKVCELNSLAYKAVARGYEA
jgi:hypothetical protein